MRAVVDGVKGLALRKAGQLDRTVTAAQGATNITEDP